MDFQLLGPVEARAGGRRVPMSGAKIHTVLAALLLARGRVVTDTCLGQWLWGGDPPATMRAQIYTYVSKLRGLLGRDVELVRQASGYVLLVHTSRVDVLEFERLFRLGRTALTERRHEDADRLLRGALDLWSGPALAGVTPFLAETESTWLEESRLAAQEHRIEVDLALARHWEVIPELTRLVVQSPLRERLRALLMTALYRCGRQADAMRLFHQGRRILAEELGVAPGPALNATYQAVLDHTLDLALEPASVPTFARYGPAGGLVPAPADPVCVSSSSTPAPAGRR